MIFDCFKNLLSNNTQNNNPKNNITKNKKLEYFEEEMQNCLSKFPMFDRNYKAYNSNICINCGSILTSKIKNTRNCPECKSKIILRTNIYNKQRLLLSENDLMIFEKFDKEMKQILFMERLMKNLMLSFSNYKNEFYQYKNRNLSARDIMYSYSNNIAMKEDNNAYKSYCRIINKNASDRALEAFNIFQQFRGAIMCYTKMFTICNYTGKNDIAMNLLADIVYREVQIVKIENLLNEFHKETLQDYILNISSGTVLKFLKEHNYTINDFKKVFIENKHPFIIPQFDNTKSWYFINESIKYYYDYYLKNNMKEYLI